MAADRLRCYNQSAAPNRALCVQMKIFSVMLKGRDSPEYFEADAWSVDNGAVTIIRDRVGPIAIFSLENLIGIVDLGAKANLTRDKVNERLEASTESATDVPFLSE